MDILCSDKTGEQAGGPHGLEHTLCPLSSAVLLPLLPPAGRSSCTWLVPAPSLAFVLTSTLLQAPSP